MGACSGKSVQRTDTDATIAGLRRQLAAANAVAVETIVVMTANMNSQIKLLEDLHNRDTIPGRYFSHLIASRLFLYSI